MSHVKLTPEVFRELALRRDREGFEGALSELVRREVEKKWKGLVKVGIPTAIIPGGATSALFARPQLTPLQPRALAVQGDIAADFELVDARVWKHSLFLSAAPVDASAFVNPREPNLPPPPVTPVVREHMDMIVYVRNRAPCSREFSGWWLCEMLQVLPPFRPERITVPSNVGFDIYDEDLDEQLDSLVGAGPKPEALAAAAAKPCAGGCGKPARPGKELCAGCAGPEEG